MNEKKWKIGKYKNEENKMEERRGWKKEVTELHAVKDSFTVSEEVECLLPSLPSCYRCIRIQNFQDADTEDFVKGVTVM